MGKIPCIKYNPNTWDYIKEQLESFGYTKVLLNDNWTIDPYIIINLDNNLGNYSNVSEDGKLCHNREIVNSTEEFLERAAKLMNKTYKRKDIFEENELRPSFAEIVSNVEYSYAVFPKDNKYIILGKIALLAEVYNEGKSVKSNETGYFFYKDKFGEIKITKHESVKYPGIIYFRNEKAVREVITILGDELNNLF